MHLYQTQEYLTKKSEDSISKTWEGNSWWPWQWGWWQTVKQIIIAQVCKTEWAKNQLSFPVATFSRTKSPSPVFFCSRGCVWNRHFLFHVPEAASWNPPLIANRNPFVMNYRYCDMILDFPVCSIWTSCGRLRNLQKNFTIKTIHIFTGNFIVSSEIIIFYFTFINGSHFFGPTKFPDFSSIFFPFYPVFFWTANLIHFSK